MRKAGVESLKVARNKCCGCKDWGEGVQSLNYLAVYGSIMSANIGYTGKPFRFCPWCGKKLVEVEDEI